MFRKPRQHATARFIKPAARLGRWRTDADRLDTGCSASYRSAPTPSISQTGAHGSRYLLEVRAMEISIYSLLEGAERATGWVAVIDV
jgi:hypothetical protein